MAVGIVDPTQLLSQMEKQIMQSKQEALTRKEILEKMEKWMSACEEAQICLSPKAISFILCSKRLVVLWDCILK